MVSHYDGLYQLKANGEWVYIGPAKGASHNANDQGDSDDADDRDGDGFHGYTGDEFDEDLEGGDGEPYIEGTSDSS